LDNGRVTSPGPQPVSIEGAVEGATFYDAVGGHPTFQRLVSAFYRRVADDPTLRAIYPEDELEAAAERLRMFLEQYWGGPHTYNEVHGHPRLRARHAPFRIDRAAHDAWLAHMRAAMDEVGFAPEADKVLWDYLTVAADMLINTD
jgi:hemoglobin